MSRRNSSGESESEFPECCNPDSSNILSYYYSISSMQIQSFSLPDSIIYYITKNPSSHLIYQKLIKTCKYFYNLNSITILCCLMIFRSRKSRKACYRMHDCFCNYEIDFNKISTSQIWLISSLYITKRTLKFDEILNSKLYRCNVKDLRLEKIEISFDEFKFLCPSVQKCNFQWILIRYQSNNNFVEFETIIENIPNLRRTLAVSQKNQKGGGTQKK